MNEQEKQKLIDHLIRLWRPIKITVPPYQSDWKVFAADIAPNIHLTVSYAPSGTAYSCLDFWLLQPKIGGSIQCNQKGECRFASKASRGSQQEHELFLAQWMPVFRCNCWLCGCPIEATAHEKAEWIQGFTHEEIEAWNLKF